MTVKTNRISHLHSRRLLLPDGNYIVTWHAGVAGKVGELRDWQGRLVSELNPIGKIPVLPVEPMEPEPLARWQVALWRWAVIVGLVAFWTVVIGVLRR